MKEVLFEGSKYNLSREPYEHFGQYLAKAVGPKSETVVLAFRMDDAGECDIDNPVEVKARELIVVTVKMFDRIGKDEVEIGQLTKKFAGFVGANLSGENYFENSFLYAMSAFNSARQMCEKPKVWVDFYDEKGCKKELYFFSYLEQSKETEIIVGGQQADLYGDYPKIMTAVKALKLRINGFTDRSDETRDIKCQRLAPKVEADHENDMDSDYYQSAKIYLGKSNCLYLRYWHRYNDITLDLI
jgi:hypothetical protein